MYLTSCILSGPTGCSRIILYISCSSYDIIYFSKELCFLLLESGVRDQDLRAGGLIALDCHGFLAFSAAAFRFKPSPVFQPMRPCTVGPAHLVLSSSLSLHSTLQPQGSSSVCSANTWVCSHLRAFAHPVCSAWSASPCGSFHSWALLVIEMSRPTLRHFSAPWTWNSYALPSPSHYPIPLCKFLNLRLSFFKIFIYLAASGLSCGMQDLGCYTQTL